MTTTVCALLVLVALIAATADATVYDGFLIDRASLDAGSVGSVNLITNPEGYSVQDATTAAAKSAGYAILAAPATSATQYGTIVNFTVDGNNAVHPFLNSLNLSRTNLKVRANGVVTNGVIVLTDLTIWDIGLDTTVTHDFNGFMVDRICLDKIVGFDGANMQNEPEKHSVHCLLYEPCVQSGFALLLKKRDTATLGYGAIYNFTTATNLKVVDWAKTLDDSRNNILFSFKGTVDSFGVITMTDDAPTNAGTGVAASFGIPTMVACIAVLAAAIFTL